MVCAAGSVQDDCKWMHDALPEAAAAVAEECPIALIPAAETD